MGKERQRAHSALQKIGTMPGIVRHHWSYAEEHKVDVIPLTRNQHSIIHQRLSYDEEEMKFRTIGGGLLSTKEEHISYIEKILGHRIDAFTPGKRSEDPFHLRIPATLKTKLEKKAKAARQSLNAYILTVIEAELSKQ